MFKAKVLFGLCVSLGLFACSPAEMPSRGLALSAPSVSAIAPQPVATGYDVVAYDVIVPRSLLVSEADVFVPAADIVWHGDPEGDRYKQIEKIFDVALDKGTAGMTEGREVRVQVELRKFHALTPKTRATTGGNFAMHFFLTVMDADTGEILDGPRMVVADVAASGGARALREEQQGITQKSVITNHLVSVFQSELAKPGRPRFVAPALTRNAFSPSDLTLAQ